jgi:competence protein ComEA
MKKFLLALLAIFALSGLAMGAVDLNTANQQQLETVKGIGPTKAKAIIDYRTKNGPFKSAEDLDKVKGFGPKTINKIAPEVTISGKPLKPMAVSGGKPEEKSTAAPATPPAAAAPPTTDTGTPPSTKKKAQ